MIPRHLLIAVGVMLVAVLVMGFYAGRMRGRVAETQPAVANTQPVAPPVSGPTERVTLYVAYDDPGILRSQGAEIPLPSARQQRAEELLRALLSIYLSKDSPHPLAAGAEVRAVGPSAANPGSATKPPPTAPPTVNKPTPARNLRRSM